MWDFPTRTYRAEVLFRLADIIEKRSEESLNVPVVQSAVAVLAIGEGHDTLS